MSGPAGSTTYLIGSYGGGPLLERLVRRLRADSPGARVVVLWDMSAPSPPLAVQGAEVWTTSVPVTWGDGSHLASLLDALARLRLGDLDWCVLLSDRSYPLRPLAELEAHLHGSGADCLLEEFSLTNPDADALLPRLRRRVVRVPGSARPEVRRLLVPLVRRVTGRTGQARAGLPVYLRFPRRRTPFGPDLTPRLGSDWWMLRGSAVGRLLDPAHAPLLAYLARVLIPSEAYAHMVLLNDPTVVNLAEVGHHVRWDDSPHPVTLQRGDLVAAFASGAWFARKFDDGPVVDEVDRRLAG